MFIGIVAFTILAYGVEAKKWDAFWCGQLGAGLLSTYLSATIIELLYELFAKRQHLFETMKLAGIAQSVKQAGIVRYGNDFRSIPFADFFNDSRHVDICFCYGNTWIEHSRAILLDLFRTKAIVRFIMIDPGNESLINALSKKWREGKQEKYSPDNLRGRIHSSKDLIFELHRKAVEEVGVDSAAQLKIQFSQSDMPHSFYRADSRMIVVFTKMCRDKDYPVHYMEVEKVGNSGFFDWVMGDVRKLAQSPGLDNVE